VFEGLQQRRDQKNRARLELRCSASWKTKTSDSRHCVASGLTEVRDGELSVVTICIRTKDLSIEDSLNPVQLQA
jgi:hypothetical protein